jgi:hypothetical protein
MKLLIIFLITAISFYNVKATTENEILPITIDEYTEPAIDRKIII